MAEEDGLRKAVLNEVGVLDAGGEPDIASFGSQSIPFLAERADVNSLPCSALRGGTPEAAVVVWLDILAFAGLGVDLPLVADKALVVELVELVAETFSLGVDGSEAEEETQDCDGYFLVWHVFLNLLFVYIFRG